MREWEWTALSVVAVLEAEKIAKLEVARLDTAAQAVVRAHAGTSSRVGSQLTVLGALGRRKAAGRVQSTIRLVTVGRRM